MTDNFEISNDWLLALNAMMDIISGCIEDESLVKIENMVSDGLRYLIKKRNLTPITVYENWKWEEKESYLPAISNATNEILLFWYNVAWELRDIFGLGQGVRKYIDKLYFLTKEEIIKRKISLL